MTVAVTTPVSGRAPELPLRLMLEDGRTLELRSLLRILPGKRLTGVGLLDDTTLLVKLFIARMGARRRWERECRGLDALHESKLPTPRVLGRGRLAEGGYYLLTEYCAEAHRPDIADVRDLTAVFRLLGRLHAAGLVHEDAHPDNFLLAPAHGMIIDGDAIRASAGALPTLDNLALLFAQLSPTSASRLKPALLAAYGEGNPGAVADLARLESAIGRARAHRMADYLSKCLRDCTLFRVEKRWDRFVSMPRAEADFLAPIIAAPDTWMEAGRPLKQGRTATLALVEHEGRPLVIKRYNIKSVGHALSRSWRPSRAWHSWVEAHRLGFLGLATPRPLALIERRLGPLRGKAWLVTEHCSGGNLLEHLAPEIPPPAAELAALGTLFHQLTAARITHGDLKATNLLWDGEGISLIDLDAMRQHGSDRTFARAWRKDRERFLANWPAGSALRAVLESSLPPSA